MQHFLVSLISIHQPFLIFSNFLILLDQNAARTAERLETITVRGARNIQAISYFGPLPCHQDPMQATEAKAQEPTALI
jgi:hypothetical protein